MLFIIGIVFLIFAFCVIIYRTPKGDNVIEAIIDTGDKYIDKIIIQKDVIKEKKKVEPPVIIGDDVGNMELEKPKISSQGSGGKNENRCRAILEKIFNAQFPSVRPNWLKNPATGRNLELDCYNHDIRLGCEYDGAQHRKAMRGQTQKDLIYQIRKDQYKDQICKKLGITLIRVPDWLNPSQFEEYITRKLKEVGKYPKKS